MVIFIKLIISLSIFMIGNFINNTLTTLATNQMYINQMKIDSSLEFYFLRLYENFRNLIPIVFVLFVIVLFIPEIIKLYKYIKENLL